MILGLFGGKISLEMKGKRTRICVGNPNFLKKHKDYAWVEVPLNTANRKHMLSQCHATKIHLFIAS